MHAYTIEVHALKSASKQIGALELSQKAAMLEKAGNEQNVALIRRETDDMLKQYLEYEDILSPYFKDAANQSRGEKTLTASIITDFFARLKDAGDELDMDSMEEVLNEMSEYRYEGEQEELFLQLKEAAAEYDFAKCEEVIIKWEAIYE